MHHFQDNDMDIAHAALHAALRQFVLRLDANDVYKLCANGSIWAPLIHPVHGDETVPTFVVAGWAWDSAIKQWAASEGLVLVCDFSELAEADAGDDVQTKHLAARHSTEVVRADLLNIIDRSFAKDWRSFLSGLPAEVQELFRY